MWSWIFFVLTKLILKIPMYKKSRRQIKNSSADAARHRWRVLQLKQSHSLTANCLGQIIWFLHFVGIIMIFTISFIYVYAQPRSGCQCAILLIWYLIFTYLPSTYQNSFKSGSIISLGFCFMLSSPLFKKRSNLYYFLCSILERKRIILLHSFLPIFNNNKTMI